VRNRWVELEKRKIRLGGKKIGTYEGKTVCRQEMCDKTVKQTGVTGGGGGDEKVWR
jgi:hypothetical protein